MSSNPLAVWKAYNDASNAGDHDTAARYLDPGLEVLVNGRASVASIEEDRAVQTELLRLYPDYHREFVDGIEVGDVATVEWRMVGTPSEPGVVPLDVAGVSVVRLAGGRLAAARLYHPTGALDVVTARALGRFDDV
ncbi:nuclear transport factor 2 family protein [Jatrophihabitans sp. YIM 134969]